MNDSYIKSREKIVAQLSRFTSFVQHMNGEPGYISFRDKSGFLGREEDFKSRIAEDARKELNSSKWEESWIGTGKIADCAIRALAKSGRLVNVNQRIDFRNRLDPKSPKYQKEAERVLYNIYRTPSCNEALSFANAVKTFGAKYDTIAFLFFVKDDTRFLPISTGHFDKGFEILGIDIRTSYRCSWENYKRFIDIINEIRSIMDIVLPMEGSARLVDAHSFIWIIQQDKFINWAPNDTQNVQIEQMCENCILNKVSGHGGTYTSTSTTFIRSSEVVSITRKRANGMCQYCGKPAPFIDFKGNPFLEVHHIIWLSRGGEDSTENTVALCPNCHARMHVLDKPEDINILKARITDK